MMTAKVTKATLYAVRSSNWIDSGGIIYSFTYSLNIFSASTASSLFYNGHEKTAFWASAGPVHSLGDELVYCAENIAPRALVKSA
jgi:hypothetical protein